MENKQTSLQELQNVLKTMQFYKRQNGFIANDLTGRLRFFDSMPECGGAFVTINDIENYIKEY